MSDKPTVYVIYYSTYGHVLTLARSIVKGLEKGGVNAKLFQVAETLPKDVLEKMHAPPKADVPIITPQDLEKADGFLFGIPIRFGTFPAQIKAFFDNCGQQWTSGSLYGKFAGVFCSTGALHSGQQTAALFSIPFFVHLGINFVPISHPKLSDISEVHGGSPFGAGTLCGDGSKNPSALELEIAESQGSEFAKLLYRMDKWSKKDVSKTKQPSNPSTNTAQQTTKNAADQKPKTETKTQTQTNNPGRKKATICLLL